MLSNDSYLDFVEQIIENFESMQVVVVGSLDDETQREEFINSVKKRQTNNSEFSENVKFHWYSSPELLEIVEIDRMLDIFISNDTGPYHLAVLSGVQTIGLFQKSLIPFYPPNPHKVIVAPEEDLKKLNAKTVAETFNNLISPNSVNHNKE